MNREEHMARLTEKYIDPLIQEPPILRDNLMYKGVPQIVMFPLEYVTDEDQVNDFLQQLKLKGLPILQINFISGPYITKIAIVYDRGHRKGGYQEQGEEEGAKGESDSKG